LPGGHFYFSPAAAALAKEIIQDLHTSADMHAPDARS
jgi:surfactin synthase thioesterase subunit